jgi:hypothetical protein
MPPLPEPLHARYSSKEMKGYLVYLTLHKRTLLQIDPFWRGSKQTYHPLHVEP